jgi:hypothetical protein
MKDKGIMFDTYDEFEHYIKKYYDNGCFIVECEQLEGLMPPLVEVWLLDVENMRVRIVYDNYSDMSDVTKEHDLGWLSFAEFSTEEFYKFISKITEV